METMRIAAVFFLLSFSSVSLLTSASVVLISKNGSRSFDDIEANFAPEVKASGECGSLYVAEPLDACSDLTNINKVGTNSSNSSPFVLIVRGGCSFEEKVRRAQKAGFRAAIVYDNEDDGVLVAMAGNSAGIKIHAVFVTKASGEVFKQHVGLPDLEVWIIPSFENSAWSIMAISFISLLAMSAVLATCFFVRRHRIRREGPQASRVREFHGMSRRLVKAMPSLIFTAVSEDNCTSTTCAICLEDYTVGEKLRILPCRHKFHAFCVDSWLTAWRTFCPVCKRDARTSTGDPPASECTPLLSSSLGSVSSASALSSFRSSLASSSAIQIVPAMSLTPSMSHTQAISRSPSVSRVNSLATTPYISQSHTSYLVSPHSLGYPSISPLNSRYMSPYAPSPANASPNLVSSSGCQLHHPLHCSESASSFSPFTSAQSLPEC